MSSRSIVGRIVGRPSSAVAVVTLAAALASVVPALDTTSRHDKGSTTSATELERRNESTVRAAFRAVYEKGRAEQVDDYFAADYVEHEQTIGAGRAGLVAAVKASAKQQPRVVPTIKHVLADGSLVAVHSQRSATPADEFSGTAAMELFRLDKGKIVEHWAFTQAVPATSRSGNSMFSDLFTGAADPVSSAREDSNKQLVLKAWAAVFTGRDFSVLDRYWATGDGYLQHNPNVPNGTGGLKGFLGTLPTSVSQNRFALADGDLVITFNQSVASSADLTSDNVGSAVADIYRVAGGRIVEHWDVVQPVPATTANGTSIFSSLYQR